MSYLKTPRIRKKN